MRNWHRFGDYFRKKVWTGELDTLFGSRTPSTRLFFPNQSPLYIQITERACGGTHYVLHRNWATGSEAEINLEVERGVGRRRIIQHGVCSRKRELTGGRVNSLPIEDLLALEASEFE